MLQATIALLQIVDWVGGRGGVKFKSGPFLFPKYEGRIKESNVSSTY